MVVLLDIKGKPTLISLGLGVRKLLRATHTPAAYNNAPDGTWSGKT
jgi:hypothetical protein